MIGDRLDLSEQTPTSNAEATIVFNEKMVPAKTSANAAVSRDIDLPLDELTERSDIEIRRQVEAG